MAEFHNGLRKFAMHTDNSPDIPAAAFAALAPTDAAAVADPQNAPNLAALGPEAAARMYLQNAFDSPQLPSLTAPSVGSAESNFQSLGTEVVPLTQTVTSKFRQTVHKIPVYGSLITVEMDQGNNLLALNTAMGEPSNVSPIAGVSPAEAISTVRTLAGYHTEPMSAVPRLNYYYDTQAERWRLVYIVEDVPVLNIPASNPRPAPPAVMNAVPESTPPPPPTPPLESDSNAPSPITPLMDYVIDAHSGDVVAQLPRTSWAFARFQITAHDALGNEQTLYCEEDAVTGQMRLNDPVMGVSTYDYQFADVARIIPALPGSFVSNPPVPWVADAVSAQINALAVLNFYRETLRRNSLDDRGFPLRSSINCIDSRSGAQGRVWKNAFWNGSQMVYGQLPVNGALRTLATALEVVGHEMTHGLTQFTARLEYQGQTGAMNESYSDIIGIMIANGNKPLDQWSWEIGAGLGSNGGPLRDMSNPNRGGQPADMAHYIVKDQTVDHGGVHTNSGIHNKAAYNLITAKDDAGALLFTPAQSAAIFYIALTQYLSRTSGFSDSRKATSLAAATLFCNDPNKQQKLDKVADAFQQVGITE